MQLRETNRGNKSLNYTLPSPIGGLNVRDSLDLMPETDAIVMDNYMPMDTKVMLRRGYARYVKTECMIKTLAEYKNADGNNRLFAFGGKTVFDITSKASVTNFEKSYTNNNWQTTQFKNRLFAVNGEDIPQVYFLDENGAGSWKDAVFTGENLILQKLINVTSSKQRLWFVEKGSLIAWYSEGVSEIQGKLLSFDLTTVARDGGYLVAVACWTQDGGQGIDDLTVFLTSEGEAIIYSGNNPNNADDWFLKGVYRISKPIGYRCILPYQGDVVIISEDGYVPLSKALPMESANSSQIAFSDKIRGLVLSRTKSNKTKEGWQGIIYGTGGYALFNVPVAQQFEQHIINTNSGAWCRFTGIRSFCWGLLKGRIYFGTDDGVMLFDEGYSDDGVAIEGQVEQAFSSLGTTSLKKVQLLNPRTKSSTPYALVVYTNTDFNTNAQKFTENIGYAGLVKWNQVKWSRLSNLNGSKWATLQGKIRSQWIGNSATGFKISLVFKTKTRGNLIEWFETGFRYEQGTGII